MALLDYGKKERKIKMYTESFSKVNIPFNSPLRMIDIKLFEITHEYIEY